MFFWSRTITTISWVIIVGVILTENACAYACIWNLSEMLGSLCQRSAYTFCHLLPIFSIVFFCLLYNTKTNAMNNGQNSKRTIFSLHATCMCGPYLLFFHGLFDPVEIHIDEMKPNVFVCEYSNWIDEYSQRNIVYVLYDVNYVKIIHHFIWKAIYLNGLIHVVDALSGERRKANPKQ